MGIANMASPNKLTKPQFPHTGFAAQGSLNISLNNQPPFGFDDLWKSVITETNDSPSSSSASTVSSFNLMKKVPPNEVWKDVVKEDQDHLVDTFNRKSPDEVVSWKENFIKQDENNVVHTNNNKNIGGEGHFGMLEDFMVRTGNYNNYSDNGNPPPPPLNVMDPMVTSDWLQLQYQLTTVPQQQQMEVMGSHLTPLLGNPVGDVGYLDNQLGPPMPMIAASSAGSQAVVDRKRHFSDEMMEKTIERRQKRMIKNRESAARSRQRKQEYTTNLEKQVSELTERNKILEKEKISRRSVLVTMFARESGRKAREQKMEGLIPLTPRNVKYQLRRTSSF